MLTLILSDSAPESDSKSFYRLKSHISGIKHPIQSGLKIVSRLHSQNIKQKSKYNSDIQSQGSEKRDESEERIKTLHHSAECDTETDEERYF